MEFPQEIYRFEAYLEFIKYSRGEYKGVWLLFFIDKTSPLILAFIAAAQPDAVLHKREALQVVRDLRNAGPPGDERTTRGEPAAGGGNHAWRGGGAV